MIIRPVGKYIGSYLAGKKFKAEPVVTSNLGLAFLSQAGVAIGMVLTVTQTYPEMEKFSGR